MSIPFKMNGWQLWFASDQRHTKQAALGINPQASKRRVKKFVTQGFQISRAGKTKIIGKYFQTNA